MSYELFRYRLPLKWPLHVGNQHLTWRQGVLLRLDTRANWAEPQGPNDGPSQRDTAWGDAAPLPGYSVDSLASIVDPLERPKSPSWQFAVDSAQIPWDTGRIPTAFLLSRIAEDVAEQLTHVADLPHRAIKLKVGRQPDPIDEATRVLRIAGSLRSDQTLRLDANRAWTFAQALQFARHLAPVVHRIEFIEEPTGNPSEFPRLWDETGLGFALDETLAQSTPWSVTPGLKALIVKPTRLGGRDQIDALARHGIPLVLSATFESGIGLLRIAQLAKHYSPDTPAGLGTYRWMADDVVKAPLAMEDGTLRWNGAPAVDVERLQRIG